MTCSSADRSQQPGALDVQVALHPVRKVHHQSWAYGHALMLAVMWHPGAQHLLKREREEVRSREHGCRALTDLLSTGMQGRPKLAEWRLW